MTHYCNACGKEIVFTGQYWQHVGNQPRHIAMPIEPTLKPLPAGGGVWVGDAPEDEENTIDNTVHTLTALSAQIVYTLSQAGVHPNLCQTVEYQIHQLWSNALRTVIDA